MFLRFLTIKNYRSLEDVTLDKLDHFNVLIGRNNAGKSSVFNALQLVNGVVNRASFEYERVLTELDTGRSLEIHLTFEPRQRDREEFLDLLYTTPELRHRRDDAQNSQLMRQIEYTLKAPEGRPDYLQPHEIRVLAENGQWTTVQRIMNPGVANPSSLLTNMDTVRTLYSGYVLNSNLLSVDDAPYTNGALVIQVDLQQRDADPATLWVWTKISDYFRNAFFFNPFRHSIESAAVQQTPQLAQDGSNLPQTLHTINSNNRQTFQEIEYFIQAALPDVGVLQAPLEGTSTRVSFRRPAAGHEVQLRDMGSGIEQLLMAATVLLTTGDESTLFLEEPESHLHAGAQRFLMEQLYSGDRQVFISTHSPTFVNLSRPRSLYRVVYSNERTKIDRVNDAQALGAALEDIGARNSDVLLSDAVLFVEGPSDRDVLRVWSETLGMSLAESNVTVLPMGGGEYAGGKTRVRGEILEGISEKAPVSHMFVLDRDERSSAEINKLQSDLGEKVFLLEMRELENYLIVPRAILAAIRSKHSDNVSITDKLDDTSLEEIEQLVKTTAEGLYGVILLKRIRAGLGGLRDGLLPRDIATSLASQARRKDLSKILRGRIKSRLNEHLAATDVDKLVSSEKQALDKEWSDPTKHQQLAPGEEILVAIFNRFGSQYNKSKDAVRIARHMRADDIDLEVKELLKKAVSLPNGEDE